MKKNITLYSLDKNLYPDIQVEVEVIENVSECINEITTEEVVPAIKCATVKAKQANVGEVVDTRPRVEYNNKVYTFSETKRSITENEVSKGAVIVVNPDGEEYVINSLEKFNKKYAQLNDGFVAIDGVKNMKKSNGNYAIKTSWGEEQIVLKGSYFCVQDTSDIYGITNSAFESTYTTDENDIKFISTNLEKIKEQKLNSNDLLVA